MASILLSSCVPSCVTDKILAWYDRHARDLPWRDQPIDNTQILSEPYQVWLSEIMLQQTTIVTVKPYFEKFLNQWPTVHDLAKASDDDVLVAWAGLGYYRRARNLIKCAKVVVDEHGGIFPGSYAELLNLPGIGPYTASAIASIAFGEPVAVVDGNVERVITRMATISETLPAAKALVKDVLQPIVSQNRPGDMAQAIMDIGATICTPKNPACILCPVSEHCLAFAAQTQELYPVKAQKKKKPVRAGAAFVLLNEHDHVWLERRASTGLLADMTQVPTTSWSASQDGDNTVNGAPIEAPWENAGQFRHTFTHFHLDMQVFIGRCGKTPDILSKGWWAPLAELDAQALPKLMRKAIDTALKT